MCAKRWIRASAVVVAALVAMVGWPAGADAEIIVAAPPVGHLASSVTGEFSGSSVWQNDPACGFVREVYIGNFDPRRHGRGGGTYMIDACIPGQDERGWIVTGPFEVVTADGVTLRGTATGHFAILGTTEFPLDLILTVAESAGASRPVGGTIAVTGTRAESGDGMSATETGTFRALLRYA
jgi:hypothetical protein